MPSLMGIDSGLTVTKAVIFDINGDVVSIARCRIDQIIPRPRFIERDMTLFWEKIAHVIKEAIENSGRPSSDIIAVAATAHGDGIYLSDKTGHPIGNGILSLDTRAAEISTKWNEGKIGQDALKITGQRPHASAPSSLLAWIKQNQPDQYAKIEHFGAAKDWINYCLTGQFSTDRTEASTSFTDVKTQEFSDKAFELFDLSELAKIAPKILSSTDITGYVTTDAAAATGLVAGTPVATGLHDVTASSLGIGAYQKDVVAIISGTYSINETLSDYPKIDQRWFCRNGIEQGEWNNMSISPASTANYDWLLDTFMALDAKLANESGEDLHKMIASEMNLSQPNSVIFHPYLFGSPLAGQSTASFLGLNAWHQRHHMVQAVIEGIAYNHRIHVEALQDGFKPQKAKIAGGISRNPDVAQLFADILAMPVITSATPEAAAWGAALCAGVAAGVYQSPTSDPRDLDTIETLYLPSLAKTTYHNEKYKLFISLAQTLQPYWSQLQALEDNQQSPRKSNQ